MMIIVACPGGFYSGGPEALHQLDHAFRSYGHDSRVLYYGPENRAVIEDFKSRYGPRIADSECIDKRGCVLILPEGESPDKWRALGWNRIAIWWLAALRRYSLSSYKGCVHLFQSKYAQAKLGKVGFVGPMLSDYIRDDVAEHALALATIRKEPHVAVNHRSAATVAIWKDKGWSVPVKVISGLSPRQALEAVASCRVFLDIGWHPGRDRMGREAALAGCSLIANYRGAAAFYEDMPLPSQLRVDEQDPSSAQALIESVIAAPMDGAMREYVAWVEAQKQAFFSEVQQVASYIQQDDFNDIAQVSATVIDSELMEELREIERLRTQLSKLGGSFLKEKEHDKLAMLLKRSAHFLRVKMGRQ